LCSVVPLGLAVFLYSLYSVWQHKLGYEWIILASLTLLTSSFTLKIPGTISKVSVAEILIVTNLLLFALFNMAILGLSAFGAGEIFRFASGRPFLYRAQGATLGEILVPLAFLGFVYYLINTVGVAAVIGLERRQRIYQVWRENFLWLSTNYAMAAITGGFLVLATPSITPAVVATVLAILMSSYFACKNYLAKAVQHP